jgi:CRISPR system Cascade subunit CasB
MDISAPQVDRPTLASTVGSIATAIEKVLSPGDVAALRKLAPDDPSCAAYWRLMSMNPGLVPQSGEGREDIERRWASILQAMATMAGLHNPRVPLGRAMAEADVAEQRLLRLLRASGSSLADAVRITAHHLTQKAMPSNHLDLAQLVLSDGGPSEDSVRRSIARSFYTQTAKEAR